MRLKCVQTLRSVFAHNDRSVATPYIHALAPRLVESLCSNTVNQVLSEAELSITVETIVTVESLISLADPKHRKYLILSNK